MAGSKILGIFGQTVMIIILPALFGSALGLLAWMKRRAA